jgi:hypothetical protein
MDKTIKKPDLSNRIEEAKNPKNRISVEDLKAALDSIIKARYAKQ